MLLYFVADSWVQIFSQKWIVWILKLRRHCVFVYVTVIHTISLKENSKYLAEL